MLLATSLDHDGRFGVPRLISLAKSKAVFGLDYIIPESHGIITRDVLKVKHPPGKQVCPEYFPMARKLVNPIIYSNLDAECILHAALHTQSSTGLSGFDREEIVLFIHICLS